MKFSCKNKRVLFVLCLYFSYLKLYKLKSIGGSELKDLYGTISCGINIVRSQSLVLYNGLVDHYFEKKSLINTDMFEKLIWWEPRGVTL